ncbi:dimethylsulfonioproprionate lyase DddP [Sneathiella sp. HT1-7]|uniref:dimethylsulfonioproprionate lyase DddP n=1 Tax=Sneathiella sp. HT1-7 TaxID=2887192 RepID=UPI001D13808B|nr:dimethylsulfonioproprionate lyase DddP [Sneathiella sp. HT1-7]MCC3303441.1 Xaa-Pro peptidase family protein [Sneathiella sp. HT1-7]
MKRDIFSGRKTTGGQLSPLTKPDGTPLDNNRVEIGPTQLAFDEWAAAGLDVPDLSVMRAQRLDRLVAALQARDYGGILMYDPLNIRFASDTTNMQLWAAHNPFRACLVLADGYMVVWDFGDNDLLTAFNPLVRETRSGASFFYFTSGDKSVENAERFAAQIDGLMREHAGSNRRLAVDKIQIHGLRALERIGLRIFDGEEVTEKTRAIKQPEEIKALRCAVHATEVSMCEMQRIARPGLTENDVWAVLHAENIKRGGEWIETRILASGPRTNPWFQECGPRVIGNNELLAFDTDLVGCFGMCADISRTWFIGDGTPTAEQKKLYQYAYDHIQQNMKLLAPGVPFKEIVFGGHLLSEEFVNSRYSVKMHGVGLCDEWPHIAYPEDYHEGAFEYELVPGMAICVEAYIGAEGGEEGVKLEEQVVITEEGYENMTHYPFEEILLT